jgi:AcrR family transcriptional regulator
MRNVTEDQAPTRRERVREATREEIKALARRQMATSGTASLALNGIARAMGMVPSALYRYFPDRDALITALILDAFGRLADALRAADAGPSYGARLLATAEVYRRWALENPVDFQLVFGNPIPDYHAPVEQTGPATQRVFAVFLDIINEAHAAGVLRPVPSFRAATLGDCPPNHAFSIYSPPVMYSGLAGWATMQGVIALEIFGHMSQSVADPDAFYRGQMLDYLAAIGLTPDSG